uniref:Uncharacterized protein n=1 Tax=Romanomermis culicivorax TaxID=13658 RepID=A0A915L889_ROMCU
MIESQIFSDRHPNNRDQCEQSGDLWEAGVYYILDTTHSGLMKNTNVYTCGDGHSAWKGPFADGMLRPVLAETCRDMICHVYNLINFAKQKGHTSRYCPNQMTHNVQNCIEERLNVQNCIEERLSPPQMNMDDPVLYPTLATVYCGPQHTLGTIMPNSHKHFDCQ